MMPAVLNAGLGQPGSPIPATAPGNRAKI